MLCFSERRKNLSLPFEEDGDALRGGTEQAVKRKGEVLEAYEI